MKKLHTILLENQEKLFEIGLYPSDLELQNFGYWLEHGTFHDRDFSVKNLSSEQILFLIELIDTHFIAYGSTLKLQLLTQFKQIIEQNNEAVLEIAESPKLIEMLVESYQNDFKSMIHLLENDALNASEVESMIEKANHIFKVMQILNLENTDIYSAMHSELSFVMYR